MEAVEPWNKNTHYGQLIQAGIEGFIKTREQRGAARFIHNEFEKQCKEYTEYEDIAWWAGLAQHTITTWIDMYGSDLDTYGIEKSECNHKVDLTLPSGRLITLNGYIDGEGVGVMMENKCRGDWDSESVAREIDLNLQVNYYLLMYSASYGALPERVWYQHIKRPGGFGYHGPRKKVKETQDEFRLRLAEAIHTDRDTHFFRYWMLPDKERHERFLHHFLYPMLEAFLDWYCYMIHPQKQDEVNRYHWSTPYGLYNPFMEGTLERFRNFRLNGSTLGLRPKVDYR
jgi:hypothetical protein